MKKSILLSSFLAISFTVSAAPRSEEAAREIAYRHFCQNTAGRSKVKARQDLVLAGTATSVLGRRDHTVKALDKGHLAQEPFYIYNNGEAGFVIVSGEDQTESVLAYGDEGAFQTQGLPEHLQSWLQTYADEIAYVAEHASDNRNHVIASQVPADPAYPSYVAPLLQYEGEKIQWDQNAPFNNECPSYLGYLCPVGCVATAFGQIMYYHRWPQQGQGGTKSYISYPNNLSQSFNFSGSTFDYDQMLPRYYYGKYSEKQGTEVARLCHGIGVAVDMQYDPSGSGAYSVYCGDAIVKYFNYDKNIHYAYRDYFTQDEWIGMIKKELSEGRPICYAGSSTSVGHQFVFDGYDAEDRVHINWGWAGMSDGYFRLTVLSPSSTGTGGGSVTSGGFIYNQAMWMGMQRPTSSSTPISHFVLNTYDAYNGVYSNSCLQIDKEQVMTGEPVTLSTTEVANLSVAFNGVFGVVIESEDGTQTVLSQTSVRNIKCGTYNRDPEVISQTFTLPSGLPDGQYMLYMASRANGEERWSRIRAAEGYCDNYEVNLSGGQARFTYNGEPDAVGSLVADHTIYTKCRSQFTARITNQNRREFFGMAHVGVYTENEDGTVRLVALCGREQVTLPSGQETEVVFRGAIEAAVAGSTVSTGNYKACVIVENQGKYYQVSDAIDITIKRIPSGMANLACEDFSLTQASYGIDEDVRGHVKVTNTRSVYSDFLGIIIFKEKSNTGTPYWEKEVFLEANVSAEYDFTIPAQFEPGTYKASLRYTGGTEYSNEVSTVVFEVRDEYVGIDEIAVEKASVSLPSYYDMIGNKLAGKPARGTYILRSRDKDGNPVTRKILR